MKNRVQWAQGQSRAQSSTRTACLIGKPDIWNALPDALPLPPALPLCRSSPPGTQNMVLIGPSSCMQIKGSEGSTEAMAMFYAGERCRATGEGRNNGGHLLYQWLRAGSGGRSTMTYDHQKAPGAFWWSCVIGDNDLDLDPGDQIGDCVPKSLSHCSKSRNWITPPILATFTRSKFVLGLLIYTFPMNVRTPRLAHRQWINQLISCIPPSASFDQKVEIELLNQYWPHLLGLSSS